MELFTAVPEETKQQAFERSEGDDPKGTSSEVCSKPGPGSTDDSEEMIGKTKPEDERQQDSSASKEAEQEDLRLGWFNFLSFCGGRVFFLLFVGFLLGTVRVLFETPVYKLLNTQETGS